MATETTETIRLDKNTALLVLSSAADGGFLDDPIPPTDEEILELASYYIEEAKKAKASGMDHPAVDAIIRLDSPALSEAADLTQQEELPPENLFTSEGTELDSENKILKKWEVGGYRSSGGFSENELEEAKSFEIGNLPPNKKYLTETRKELLEGLPIPKPTEEAVPYDMPTDLTDLGDKELRRLHSAFNAYLGRARWLLAIATSNLANATHVRDEEYRMGYKEAYGLAERAGTRLTKDSLDNMAKDYGPYKDWNDKVLKHSNEVTQWRALADIYSGNVDRLSREWTMRTEQYEREH